MSDGWLRHALRACRTGAEARIVRYLAQCARRHGRATPARAWIATAAGCCERTVSRAIGRLEALGVLAVVRDKPFCRDGRWQRNRTNWYLGRFTTNDLLTASTRQRGHGCHLYAPQASYRTVAAARKGAAARPRGAKPRLMADPPANVVPLFGGAQLPPPDLEHEPDRPTAPPWITLGITRDEWLARQHIGI